VPPAQRSLEQTGELRIARAAPALLYDSPAAHFWRSVTAFYDGNALVSTDPDHSSDEEQFLLLGLSDALRFLLVAHCDREGDTVIRLISARRATRSERIQYDARRLR